MFKSRKRSSPHVSPLALTPEAEQVSGSGSQSGSQSRSGGGAPAAYRQANGTMATGQTVAGPAYGAGMPFDRVNSVDTMTSAKSEKRRSFFGLGGKKDKDKDKVMEHERPAPQSFSVSRERLPISPPPSQAPNAQQYGMRPFPGGGDPPGIRQASSGRIVSQPQQPPPDFGGAGSMLKSQSMGFNRPVPETHPYRGYLNAQEDHVQQQQQQSHGMPRSNSMPMDRLPAPVSTANGHLPPRDRSSPANSSVSRGTGPSARISDEKPQPQFQSQPNDAAPPQGQTQPAWMKDFQAIVELIGMQPQKTYVASPPELEMILARTSVGGQPKQGQPGSASNDWDAVWLQLSGISLSMWSMKETRAAAAKGEKVPPTYFNITDSSLELLAPLPPPPHRPNSHPHHYVFSLNTAGSNRLLFSCPSERDLAKWTTGLRLAAWERARLEELYTGHLIKSAGKEPKSEVFRGRMEGWVRVRVMGGVDWKRLWVVLSTPGGDEAKEDEKKGRRRSFFGNKPSETVQEPNTGISMASFYLEPRTQKNKTSPAVLTITNVTQAYAMFPERLDVISQSNLMKVIGRIGGELVTIEGRLRDSGWALIMPEAQNEPALPGRTPLAHMMRLVTGFHDVFRLYGRPEGYNWNQQDPRSLFFAYPTGSERSRLFLDIDQALMSDFRATSLPIIRGQFTSIMQRRLQPPAEEYREDEHDQPTPRLEGDYRLPPLSFGEPSPHHSDQSVPRSLTPITERTDFDGASRQNSQRTAKSDFFGGRQVSAGSQKQSSGGSTKHPSGDQQDRLATIADAETGGVVTEEPRPGTQQSAQPQQSGTGPPPQTPPFTTPTTVESQTGGTVWSQDSAMPTPMQSKPSSPLGEAQASAPLDEAKDLPDLPSSTSSTGPVLAAPVVTPKPSPEVLSPAPRRVASGEIKDGQLDLHEEPAAKYLMNMVEEPNLTPPKPVVKRKTPSPERPRIVTSFEHAQGQQQQQQHLRPETLGRKPSGARAPPPKKGSTGPRLDAIPAGDEPHARDATSGSQTDLGEDAAAFMSYAELGSPVKPKTTPSATSPQAGRSALAPASAPPPAAPAAEQMRSSFAPSKAAAERRAKAEAAEQDTQRAMARPGGGKRIPSIAGNWSGSDEDEEETDDSPVMATRQTLPRPPAESAIERSTSRTRALPPLPHRPEVKVPNGDRDHFVLPFHVDRPRSHSPGMPRHAQPLPHPAASGSAPPLPTSRTTVWNANFAADHGMAEPNKSGKFVELEEPQAQLTKAFAPHGLLQAGMQDKEDRSAKKQEELARETGSSLINVPSKPPPPQTGLLGAVAAHERERRNAGGIGATLTDRERERRFAEERQREIEKLQRQQAEHVRQYGGDLSGPGQYPYGMNMNMGMMGMPPMGYPYQGGYNPYAQQQAMMAAQMAYQHAMMAMSHAGSQYGGGSPDRPASPASVAPGGGGGGSGFNPYGGYPSPNMSMSMGHGGWPGMVPWATGSGPASPAVPGMPLPGMPGMPAMPGMGMGTGMGSMSNLSQGGYGASSEWLHPQTAGSGTGTPFDQRSRVHSNGSEVKEGS